MQPLEARPRNKARAAGNQQAAVAPKAVRAQVRRGRYLLGGPQKTPAL